MASNNDPANRPESQPSDLFSSGETRAMLEEFRELVRAGILRVTPENEVLSTQESAGGPAEGKQPRAPASREEDVAALDKQLLEWLDRRRQQKAENAQLKPEPEVSWGAAGSDCDQHPREGCCAPGAEDPRKLGARGPGRRPASFASRAGNRAPGRRDPTALAAAPGIAREPPAPRLVRPFPARKNTTTIRGESTGA